MVDQTSENTIIHIEAEPGSSMLDVTIQNADAAQLFAAAGIIHSNAQVALAAQMQEQSRPSRLDVLRGKN